MPKDVTDEGVREGGKERLEEIFHAARIHLGRERERSIVLLRSSRCN